LRDIEGCLAANQSKLFHMGLAQPPARSTLADALNARHWRIYQALALRLISRARALYADEPVLDIDATVYALDATTVELCLSLFDWAPVHATRAAIKLHTLLDLRGAIPAFLYISDGMLNDLYVLDFLPLESGSFYVMDRGYLDFGRLFAMHQARGLLRYPCQVRDGYTPRILLRHRAQPWGDLRSARHAERSPLE
jgi:hypothetical protein